MARGFSYACLQCGRTLLEFAYSAGIHVSWRNWLEEVEGKISRKKTETNVSLNERLLTEATVNLKGKKSASCSLWRRQKRRLKSS